MADTPYIPALVSIGLGQIHLVNDDIRATLIDVNDYTLDALNHQFLSSVPVAARIATQTLTGKSFTATAGGAVFDANNPTYPGLSGDQLEAIILWKMGTGDGDSRLIYYLDSAGGLPLTPDGRPVEIRWSDGPSKIFRLRAA